MKTQIKYVGLAMSLFLCLVTLRAQNILQPVKSISVPNGQESQDNIRDKFCFYGGISVPTGAFIEAGKDDWAATSGFTFGMQYSSGRNIGFIIDASFTRNSAKFEGFEAPYGVNPKSYIWNFYYLICGLRIATKPSQDVDLMVAPLIGINISSSPYVHYNFDKPVNDYNYGRITYLFDVELESNTRMEYAGGVMAQVSLNCIIVGARYLTSISASRYKMNVSDYSIYGPFSSSDNRSQCISFFQIYAGYSF